MAYHFNIRVCIGRVVTSATFVVGIVLAGTAAGAQTGTRWTFTRTELKEEEPRRFITAACLSPSGRAYLATNHPNKLQVYDQTGHPAGFVGRQGKGPGEFEYISTCGFRGDTLWVFDETLNRVSYFDERGKVIRTQTPVGLLGSRQAEGWGERLNLVGLMPDGSVLAGDALMKKFRVGSNEGYRPISRELVRLPRTALGAKAPAKPLSSLGVIETRHCYITLISARGNTSDKQPWSDCDVGSVSPGAVIHAMVRQSSASRATGATFEVTVSTASGVLWKKAIPYTPIAITDAQIEEVWKHQRDLMAEYLKQFWGSEKGARKAFDDSLFRPSHMPPVRLVLAADDSTVWIARSGATMAQSTWEVYGPTGQLLGAVDLPNRFTPFGVSKRAIWAWEQNEEGEYLYARYEIRK